MTDRYRADAEELRTRKRLVDAVGSSLTKAERETDISLVDNSLRETGIQFLGTANEFKITTYKPAIVRKLLAHDYARIEWVYVHREDAQNRRVGSVADIDEDQGHPTIEGICAWLPLGALTIKGSPRKSDKPSKVAHTPDDAKQAREVFE